MAALVEEGAARCPIVRPADSADDTVAAAVLLFDEEDRVLLVDPVYKPDWEFPGGVVERGEAPTLAAVREAAEELGLRLDPEALRLLAVDWEPRTGPRRGGMRLVYDGGRLTAAQRAGLRLPPDELRDWRFVTLGESERLLSAGRYRRLASALEARGAAPRTIWRRAARPPRARAAAVSARVAAGDGGAGGRAVVLPVGEDGRMPFTFSHPAAVLPLLRGLRGRGPLVASALVAGSMAPDLPFFAASWCPGLYRCGAPTHRWWAVATVDVALAGVLVAGWQGVLRRPLLELLPPRWAAPALEATARRAARTGAREQAAWFALSAALGAVSHVGWDAFTHPGRAGGRLLPVLERRVAGLPLCTALQYGSSALGLAALGSCLARELGGGQAGELARPPDRRAARRRARRRALVGAAATAGAAHRLARAGRVRGPSAGRDPIADLCFGAGAGALAAAAVLGVADLLGPPRQIR